MQNKRKLISIIAFIWWIAMACLMFSCTTDELGQPQEETCLGMPVIVIINSSSYQYNSFYEFLSSDDWTPYDELIVHYDNECVDFTKATKFNITVHD